MMSNPEPLTAEWQFAPAAALSDLSYTGMAIMRWTCRTAPKRSLQQLDAIRRDVGVEFPRASSG
jgi:hypothetical protein